VGELGETVFENARGAIEDALRFVAYRRRLTPVELEDLRSFVWLKLVENDYSRLRQYQADGSMTAYLSVVVHRLYLDDQIGKWGKWHGSTEARRRGEVAVALERLIYRDGLQIGEAVELLRTTRGGRDSREELFGVAYDLPTRHRPKFVSEDYLYEASTFGVDPVERRERAARARKLQEELTQAMQELRADELRMLQLRFGEKRSVPQVASILGVDAKPLYARMRRLLDRIRKRLEYRGFGREEASSLVAVAAHQIDLDQVFSGTAA